MKHTTVTQERIASLAADIRARRRSLANEERNATTPGLMNHARAKKYRDLEAAQINGMVIALTWVLGRPLDMQHAEYYLMGMTP